jgi:cyclic pyranopterin monophosphate synthase
LNLSSAALLHYPRVVRLYQLDSADSELSLLPMAARRALDAAGLHLNLAAWQSLPLLRRQALVQLGSGLDVVIDRVRELAAEASPVPESCPVLLPPVPERIPLEVTQAFGAERPIPLASWAALAPLDRYVLMKVASRARPERLNLAYQEIIGQSAHSSHLAPGGGVRMVDVSAKQPSLRRAVAASRVTMNSEAYSRLLANNPKGDVLGSARLAGIMASKRTADLIPLCHPLALSKVELQLSPNDGEHSVSIVVTVEAVERTGVEMEALTAASVAALTIYDMLKAFDRTMSIGPTELLFKSGGRTGDYERGAQNNV